MTFKKYCREFNIKVPLTMEMVKYYQTLGFKVWGIGDDAFGSHLTFGNIDRCLNITQLKKLLLLNIDVIGHMHFHDWDTYDRIASIW